MMQPREQLELDPRAAERRAWAPGEFMVVRNDAEPETNGVSATAWDPVKHPHGEHGHWATVAKEIAKDLEHEPYDSEWNGRGEPWSQIEHDYGDAVDERTFTSDGASVGFHHEPDSDSRQVLISFPGADKDRWSVLAAMDPDSARNMADDIEHILDIDLSSEDYADMEASANGLIDWTEDRDGAMVGIDPQGDIRIGIPAGPGKLDETDLSPDEAQALADGLRAMADQADEYEAQ